MGAFTGDDCYICAKGARRGIAEIKNQKDKYKAAAINSVLAFPYFSWLRYPRIAWKVHKVNKKVWGAIKKK